jgi:asparagine synthase (glutamine-hydrolysing)
MCGIAALFSAGQTPMGGLIRGMTDSVRHRGPDDEGFALLRVEGEAQVLGGAATPANCYGAALPYAPSGRIESEAAGEAHVALGHRRLSIVDLSPAGHQPMCSAERRYWITYNGEIYNHVELRTELESLGHAFLSHSDTEVILHAYREWGDGCLHRFNGMFAFILIDRTARKVLIARDRFGVKPLYFWRAPSGLLAFASEIKQFCQLPEWAPTVNGQRAYDFLNWALLDHTDGTLFDTVRQLRGGELIHCALTELVGDLPVRRWYQLEPKPFVGSFEEGAQQLRTLLIDAVRLRLRADVPVGSCLSGGLDSSSIVCVANAILRDANAEAQQRTFSACSEIKRYDEREFIEEVAKLTGVEGHYTYPTAHDLLRDLDAIVWHQDEPFGSTSIFAQWQVFALAARTRVKVLLDGQGADEILAGYHSFFGPHFAGLLRSLRWLVLWREMRAAAKAHPFGFRGGARFLASAALPDALRRPIRSAFGNSILEPNWIDAGRMSFRARDPFAEFGFKTSSLNGAATMQLLHASVPMLLHWEDRNSMAHAVESRLPFLDYRLAEFVMGLPGEFKLSDATTKRVLRGAMAGILPEKVRRRMDKMGFVTPEEVWLRETAPDTFRSELRRAIEASRGVLRPNALDHLDAVVSGQRRFSSLPWRMISFGRWMEKFGVRLSATPVR